MKSIRVLYTHLKFNLFLFFFFLSFYFPPILFPFLSSYFLNSFSGSPFSAFFFSLIVQENKDYVIVPFAHTPVNQPLTTLEHRLISIKFDRGIEISKFLSSYNFHEPLWLFREEGYHSILPLSNVTRWMTSKAVCLAA